jgi:hypothetical protein
MLLLIIILILLFGGVGFHQWGTSYGTGGISLGTILLIVLIIMLLRGNI